MPPDEKGAPPAGNGSAPRKNIAAGSNDGADTNLEIPIHQLHHRPIGPGELAALSLQEKLERFALERDVLVQFCVLGITERQIEQMALPTRKPKRKSAVDKTWEYDFACELDAMPPDVMRSLVEQEIQIHLPADQLAVLKVAEASEREMLKIFSTQFAEEART